MSTQTSIPKTLYCKKASFLKTDKTPVLQSLLGQSLKTLKLAKNRREVSGDNERYNKVVLFHNTSGGVLCGVFASYEKGMSIAAIVENDTDEIVSINQMGLPKIGNKEQELLEGICFFGVSKNDVIVIPSRSLSVKDLELHLNWLLSQASQIDGENRVFLAEQVTKDIRAKLKSKPVNSITLGDSLLRPSSSANSNAQEGTSTANQVVVFEAAGWIKDKLSSLIGEDKFKTSGLSDAINEDIHVELKIKFAKSRTDAGDKAISNLAIALRHADEDDVKIGLTGGGTIFGKELKLKKATSILGRDGIPDQERAFEAIRTYFTQLISDKTIDAK